MRALAGLFVVARLVIVGSLSVMAGQCSTLVCDDNSTIMATGGIAPSVAVTSTAGGESHTRATNVSAWVASCFGEVVTGKVALGLFSGRAVPFGRTEVAAGFDPDASWGLVRCPDHPNVGVAGDFYAIYEVATPPQRVIDIVVARASGATVLPELAVLSSPSGSANRPLVTGLSSWLWLEGWRSASASASLPGIVASVTATPASNVSWRLDAGGHVEAVDCQGPGVATLVTCELAPAVRGQGELSAQVRWEYRVACTPACAVALPDEVVDVSIPVRVAEVRGVIVG